MDSQTQADSPRVRVFADDSGKVFLTVEREQASTSVAMEHEKAKTIQLELSPPITPETLQVARHAILDFEEAKKKKAVKALVATMPPARQNAVGQIEVALDPFWNGPLLDRLKYLSEFILLRLLGVLILLMGIAAVYKVVQYSSEHFPSVIHFAVIVFYVVGMGYLLFLISGENPTKYNKHIKFMFGPYALLVIPFLLVGSAAAVLASITTRLYARGSVMLEPCAGRAVSESGLMDFYVWHFVNIIPLVQINNLIRWGEPYCYKQSRVGFLILIYQLLVVLPSLNAIRKYWNRKTAPEFVFDPDWEPESKQT